MSSLSPSTPPAPLSMHKALTLPDILRLVCQHADRPSLCSLATTTRMIHNLAIEQIWASLDSLVHLLRCFPEDAWNVNLEGKFELTRVLMPNDWTSVLKYASYVQELNGLLPWSKKSNKKSKSKIQVERMSESAWQMVCALRPTFVLFPRLRTLEFSYKLLSIKCLPSLLFCVGGNVTMLGLQHARNLVDDQQTLQACLSIATHRFSALADVTLWDGTLLVVKAIAPLPVATLAVSKLATATSTLTRFSCATIPLPCHVIIHLLSLSTIHSLEVYLQDDSTLSNLGRSFSQQSRSRAAARPQELRFNSSVDAYVALSRAVEIPHASCVCLTLLDGDLPGQRLLDVFGSIRYQFSPSALHVLHLTYDSRGSVDGAQWFLRPADLRPLLDFNEMRDFRLTLPCEYTLDEAALSSMATAWAHLTAFEVGTTSKSDNAIVDSARLPTIRVLPLFAIHCPKLTELTLAFGGCTWVEEVAFDADYQREEIYGALAKKASTSVMQRLCVGRGSQSDFEPRFMAAFLARIFPHPKFSVTCYGFCSPHVGQWRAVQGLLRICQRIREDEQLRMAQATRGEDTDGVRTQWS
ncbi:hypothetical protein C8Q77DRAFT_1124590 [Trametes polyzona]|nr:hypothetical protein C8Q77DRAFT_1124590 [Trametes polyzona]